MAKITATFPFDAETPSEIDFGSLYGLAATYLRSRTSSRSATGFLRLANGDTLNWRNAGNTSDISFGAGSSNAVPSWGGVDLVSLSTAQALTNKTIDALLNTISNISDTNIKAAAAIALSKLTALATSRALQSNASTGFIEVSNVTNTELAFLSGVTSAIQTQINSKQTTGNYITALTSEATASGPGSVAITLSNAAVIAKVLTGFVSGAGTVSSSDSLLAAIQKIVGVQRLTPTAQVFTSGSGTYTLPSNPAPKYVRVRMVGGGGGGGGSGSTGNNGSSGGNSTFGSSLLTANGGQGGVYNGGGGQGGGASVNSPATQLVAVSGTYGNPLTSNAVGNSSGGEGAYSVFGGAGAGGYGNTVNPTNSVANTGSGGGGGGGISTTDAAGGGGAGGYIEALITSPSSTYSYAVGASGSGGAAGTNGLPGGNGGSGIIIVEEHY